MNLYDVGFILTALGITFLSAMQAKIAKEVQENTKILQDLMLQSRPKEPPNDISK